MSSRTTGDKKTRQTALINERRVDEPTTSRHRARTPETKNDKRTQGICTMGATTVCELSTVVAATRQRRHPSISAKGECLTLHVLAPRKVSIYTLDQQEEIATVLAVLRSRQSARNTDAYSPRDTLSSASIRSWLSVSAHQNHGTPSRHVFLSGTNRRHAVQT